MLLNYGVGGGSWESLGLQGDQTSPSIKEISPEYSLEGLMLRLKLQYFGHLMQRTDSFEKNLIVGKIEGGRRRGQQRMKWLGGITDTGRLWEYVNARYRGPLFSYQTGFQRWKTKASHSCQKVRGSFSVKFDQLKRKNLKILTLKFSPT